MTMNNVADLAAKLTLEAFDSFNASFQTITRRAQQRFEAKDWAGGQRDATERLDAYESALDNIAVRLEAALNTQAREHSLWVAAKHRFASLVAHRYDIDRAETFFNSVTRKMLMTVGINRDAEFFYLHPKAPIPQHGEMVYRTYTSASGTISMVRKLLEDFLFNISHENIERDTKLVAQEIDLHLWPIVGGNRTYTADVVKALFFRNKGAYILGRIVVDGRAIPLVIPLANGESGIYADTVLLHEPEASVVFSFAYSYFFVDVERFDALIEFLRSILPHAELAELYTSLGYNRHGKTEFYRELHRFVHVSREQFTIAPGLEGAVMIAFTL
ncbi:MAG TPA: hypothetical protein DGH68_00950, partial [Bacteroidetes bacterium]|nr:hypothetical protein [Bacteroidota bacterium]